MAIMRQLHRAKRRASNSWRKFRHCILSTKNEKKLFQASHSIVTPFSGFLISDLYFSEEIDFHNFGWLNTKARRITLRRIKARTSPAILYCQADQIESFISNYLPHIRFPFSLITGKWHLPSLKPNESFLELFSNEWLVEWYSQNQVDEESPIHPFPYGVNFENVVTFAGMHIEESVRELKPLIPFSTIHAHMKPEDRIFREGIKTQMQPRKSFDEYLSDLKQHKYVICTPGDRPDTYRHWESIACGAIPITLKGKNFEALFQDSAIYSDNFFVLSPNVLKESNARHREDIVHVDYWKQRIKEALLK